MQQETVLLTGKRELGLRRMFERIVRATVRCPHQYDEVRRRGREIAVLLKTPDAAKGPSQPKPKHDFAEQHRARFEAWYRGLGFTDLVVPKPEISNREFRRRANLDQALFYRPASSLVSYEVFMTAVGQGSHWTVVDAGERAQIAWEPTESGYWFWAEIAVFCPRFATPWNDLTASITLLSLEEYVIVRWAHKALTGVILDESSGTWLRTKFGQSAFSAGDSADWVGVSGHYDPAALAGSFDDVGGRAAEVV